jgi:CheY-like chemotaxis protein
MSRPVILLVDDNPELVNLLARLVQAEGWEAVTAQRGKAGLEALAARPPSAAVIDVLLPDMMGYELGDALKKAGIPYVFMTGIMKGGRAASEARAKHGADGYFEKPFPGKKLMDALRDLLPPQAPTRASQVPPPEKTDDFDVDVAVEIDEPAEAFELTGRVVLTEGGIVSAVLRGQTVTAGPLGTPARPAPPFPPPPPPPAAQVHAASERAREARRLAGTAPEQGQLDEKLPDLLAAFHLAQQTGELTVQRAKVKKTIYFEAGAPCFAISNLVTDRFGPFLVRVGKITQSQLLLVRAAADKTGRRTGDILAEMKLLKETEKLYFVAQQVKAIIYSLFAWEEGEFRLHFTDRAAEQAIKIDLHPAHLITRGIKKLYKPERLFRLLSPEDRLIPTPQPAFGLHEVELEKWEAELLPRVDGTRPVAELVALARRPEQTVYGFLYGLVALKILDRR